MDLVVRVPILRYKVETKKLGIVLGNSNGGETFWTGLRFFFVLFYGKILKKMVDRRKLEPSWNRAVMDMRSLTLVVEGLH